MKLCIALIGLLLILSCSSDDDAGQIIQTDCDALTEVLSVDDYDTILDGNFGISEVSLDGDCLSITISASGCDPNNWEMNLYSPNVFITVMPTTRPIKVELINNEACLAFFQKTMSFDLIPIQLQNENEILLNLEGWSSPINYQY